MQHKTKAVIVESVLGALVGFVAVGLAYSAGKDSITIEAAKQEKREVHVHILKDENIVCATYRNTMQCFPYVDEGTHLSYPDARIAR